MRLFVCLSVFSPSRVSCLSSGVICCNTLSFCLSEGRSAGEKVFLLVRTRLHFPVILEVYFHQAQGFCWLRWLAAPFPPAAGVCRSPTARRAVPTSARPPRGAAGTRRLLLGEARGPRKAPEGRRWPVARVCARPREDPPRRAPEGFAPAFPHAPRRRALSASEPRRSGRHGAASRGAFRSVRLRTRPRATLHICQVTTSYRPFLCRFLRCYGFLDLWLEVFRIGLGTLSIVV